MRHDDVRDLEVPVDGRPGDPVHHGDRCSELLPPQPIEVVVGDPVPGADEPHAAVVGVRAVPDEDVAVHGGVVPVPGDEGALAVVEDVSSELVEVRLAGDDLDLASST